MGPVFERFSDRARRVVVLAQEEARLLGHDHIGTEHLLLGVVHEGEGVGAEVLASLGLTLDVVRAEVRAATGEHGREREAVAPAGHIPFTPRAKKVLELSLRESLQLGHDYIGTEHVLLGLLREERGVAARVLTGRGADLRTVRERVLEVLRSAGPAREAMEQPPLGDPLAAWASGARLAPDQGPRCPRCRVPVRDKLTTVPTEAGERSVVVVACAVCGTAIGVLPA